MLGNWKILAISCLVAGIGLVQTATLDHARAGDADRAPASRLDAPAVTDTDAVHPQRATSMYGLDGENLNPGYNAIDSMTIRCPKGHCRIAVTAYVQLSSLSDDNDVGVCITFDGYYGPLGCPRAARLQIDDSRTGITTISNEYDLPKGNYNIGLQIFTDNGAQYYQYAVNAESFTRKP